MFQEFKLLIEEGNPGRLRQAKVNDFSGYNAALLDIHHDVAWFDVSVNEFLSVPGSNLGCDFERQLHLKPV
jgi:hypothetical protein